VYLTSYENVYQISNAYSFALNTLYNRYKRPFKNWFIFIPLTHCFSTRRVTRRTSWIFQKNVFASLWVYSFKYIYFKKFWNVYCCFAIKGGLSLFWCFESAVGADLDLKTGGIGMKVIIKYLIRTTKFKILINKFVQQYQSYWWDSQS